MISYLDRQKSRDYPGLWPGISPYGIDIRIAGCREFFNIWAFAVESTIIALIGLGYVGLPLAVEFAKHYPVAGFDINEARVAELRAGKDSTLEVDDEALRAVLATGNPLASDCLLYTSDAADE